MIDPKGVFYRGGEGYFDFKSCGKIVGCKANKKVPLLPRRELPVRSPGNSLV
jgi:hypothetical protein